MTMIQIYILELLIPVMTELTRTAAAGTGRRAKPVKPQVSDLKVKGKPVPIE
jgi:hypothetical protein